MSAGADLRHPYSLLVELCVCTCATYPRDWGHYANLGKAIAEAGGYWNVYSAFWGDLPRLINVTIVDSRDGRIIWRNGRQLVEVEGYGADQQNHRSEHGPNPGAGRGHPGVGQAVQRGTGSYSGPYRG